MEGHRTPAEVEGPRRLVVRDFMIPRYPTGRMISRVNVSLCPDKEPPLPRLRACTLQIPALSIDRAPAFITQGPLVDTITGFPDLDVIFGSIVVSAAKEVLLAKPR